MLQKIRHCLDEQAKPTIAFRSNANSSRPVFHSQGVLHITTMAPSLIYVVYLLFSIQVRPLSNLGNPSMSEGGLELSICASVVPCLADHTVHDRSCLDLGQYCQVKPHKGLLNVGENNQVISLCGVMLFLNCVCVCCTRWHAKSPLLLPRISYGKIGSSGCNLSVVNPLLLSSVGCGGSFWCSMDRNEPVFCVCKMHHVCVAYYQSDFVLVL